MRQFVLQAHGVVAAVLILGFAAEVQAAVPRGILLQRRSNTFRMPSRPAIVDSSPTIDSLNKALNALGATDRDYDGHRERAIAHIGAAIHLLETPNARGKSNATVEKAATGKPAVATRTATTPQAASDESLRQAKATLFAVHDQLTEHTATRGHIRADAEIRIAIDEIAAALKPGTTTPSAKAAAAPAASTTPGKPAK
jgi:hypothetical protein